MHAVGSREAPALPATAERSLGVPPADIGRSLMGVPSADVARWLLGVLSADVECSLKGVPLVDAERSLIGGLVEGIGRFCRWQGSQLDGVVRSWWRHYTILCVEGIGRGVHGFERWYGAGMVVGGGNERGAV